MVKASLMALAPRYLHPRRTVYVFSSSRRSQHQGRCEGKPLGRHTEGSPEGHLGSGVQARPGDGGRLLQSVHSPSPRPEVSLTAAYRHRWVQIKMLPCQPALLGDGGLQSSNMNKSSSMAKACLGGADVAQRLTEDARHPSDQMHSFQERKGE